MWREYPKRGRIAAARGETNSPVFPPRTKVLQVAGGLVFSRQVGAWLDEVEPDSPTGEDTPACPVCSWDCGNHSLGILGSLRWWRCRGCGIDFHDNSHTVREATTLRTVGNEPEWWPSLVALIDKLDRQNGGGS